MMANGCWDCAVAARRSAVGLPELILFSTKRLFPSLSLANAASAGTDGSVGSAANMESIVSENNETTMTPQLVHVFIRAALQTGARLNKQNYFVPINSFNN